MQFQIKSISAAKHACDAAIVFTRKSGSNATLEELNGVHNQVLSLTHKKSTTKAGDALDLTLINPENDKPSTYYLVQLDNDKSALTYRHFKKTISNLTKKVLAAKHTDLTIFVDDVSIDGLDDLASARAVSEALATEFRRAAYKYTHTLSEKKNAAESLKTISLVANTLPITALEQGLEKGESVANGINFARELGNLPGNYCTPTQLGEFAKGIAKDNDLLTVKTLGAKAIEELGMGSFLSVARGGDEEPCFIILEYKGSNADKPHVLVGKGITFDTGGISLKPGPSMDEMKFDMCGAASVLGTIQALVDMKAPVHVVGLIAAAENMPSGRATKPGDVVTSMSGTTIEVLNTDAEGRLVLCDALTYAERYKPKSVVDIATLTGACVIALGRHATGLYSNHQALADKLLAAGERSGDRAWQMPLWDEYQDHLKSNFADMANIGNREAGSVTAACFLSRFAKKYHWAHLDIAGPAWHSGSNKGATGRPVELLVNYLLND